MSRARIGFGLLLTSIGIVLFIYASGGVGGATTRVGRWWPALLIALGVFYAFRMSARPLAYIGPLLMAIVGAGLLDYSVGGLTFGQGERLSISGTLLIGAGVVIALVGEPKTSLANRSPLIARRIAILHGRRISHSMTKQPTSIVVVVGYLEYNLRAQPASLSLNVFLLAGQLDILVRPQTQVTVSRAIGIGCRVDGLEALDQSAIGIELNVIAFGGLIRVLNP